jgi:hypothetical protein
MRDYYPSDKFEETCRWSGDVQMLSHSEMLSLPSHCFPPVDKKTLSTACDNLERSSSNRLIRNDHKQIMPTNYSS